MIVHVIQEETLMPVALEKAQKLVEEFNRFYDVNFDEASLYFVDTPKICELHAQFFDDPSPTDCISFPMDDADDDGYRIMGDVFVCPATAMNYVLSNGGDTYQELTLYVVHGLLHLIGYDDIEDDDRLEMKTEEARFLEHVKTAKLWLSPKN